MSESTKLPALNRAGTDGGEPVYNHAYDTVRVIKRVPAGFIVQGYNGHIPGPERHFQVSESEMTAIIYGWQGEMITQEEALSLTGLPL